MAVSYVIVGGNDNLGKPGFGVRRTTARNGVVFVASNHDYVWGLRYATVPTFSLRFREGANAVVVSLP